MNNYAGIFNVGDRLFGSFVSMDTAEADRFGCPGEVDTYPQRFRDAVRRPPQDVLAHLARRRQATAGAQLVVESAALRKGAGRPRK